VVSNTDLNVQVLDAAYKPFPSFKEWESQTVLDTVRWDRYNSLLQSREGVSAQVLERARQTAKRAAALDTGAIEGLYDVDRGFTYTVALETSAWELMLGQKGEHVRPLFDAQLHAYDYVLDLATKAEPISEAAIRTLHEVVCAAQPTYRVNTAVGPQEQALPKGQYKALPNHVRTRKGTDHSYAPVDVTPPEMARLVAELRSDAFLAAHPVLQAAYAHYGLVVIHPFADGNGRVARALASAFTYRRISMPIVILLEHQNVYLDSLESADSGNFQPFVDFILARSLDTIKLVDESVRSALSPSAGQSIAAIKSLYITKGGYTHQQVDDAGIRFIQIVADEVKRVISENTQPNVSSAVNIAQSGGMPSVPSGYRNPIPGGRVLQVVFNSQPPARAHVSRNYFLLLPRDAAGDDDIQLYATTTETFTARMDEIIPLVSGMLTIRARMFAEGLIGELLDQLRTQAEAALRATHSDLSKT